MAPQASLRPAPAPQTVAANLAVIRSRIAAAGGDSKRVKIVAVTKGFGPEAIRAVLEAGLTDVGENYASELVAKATELALGADPLASALRWHYLGAIQRRSVKKLAPLVSCWQSVCRVEEGRSLAAHYGLGAGGLRSPEVLVQVDTTGIEGRNGCRLDEAPVVVEELRRLGLQVKGLMTIAAPGSKSNARTVFRQVARLRVDLGLEEMSMGMSDDLELAVAEGATMVRVGRALFGERAG